MGDMGLPGAYGAAGAAEALRAIIKDRLQREQQQFENSRLLAGDARENRRLDQNDKFRQDTLDERANVAKQASADRQIGLANTLGDQLPAGLELPPTDRAVGLMQSGGRGGLLRGNMTLPSTQTGGGMTMPDAGGAPISGTLRSMSSPEALRSYTKLPSEKQNVDAANTADKQADNGRQAARDTETGRHNKVMENRPQPVSTVTIQTVDDQGNPVTRVVPKKDAMGHDFAARPSAQDAQHTRTNKETLDTLSQLDQAIENAKDLIGPGAGRISNLEQMAGSADPRIQALGVKMKAAKMRVDHAVTGSVRAGASPQMMQQWDNILANKVTPEGLKAGVQAMREIISSGGGAPSGAGGTVEKWGRDAAGNLVKQ